MTLPARDMPATAPPSMNPFALRTRGLMKRYGSTATLDSGTAIALSSAYLLGAVTIAALVAHRAQITR